MLEIIPYIYIGISRCLYSEYMKLDDMLPNIAK